MTLFLAIAIVSRRNAVMAAEDGGDVTLEDNLSNIFQRLGSFFATIYTAITGRVERIVDGIRRSRTRSVGVPMPFDYSNDNDGWGVCSLRSP